MPDPSRPEIGAPGEGGGDAWLVVRVAGTGLAMPARTAERIEPNQALSPIPLCPAHIRGLLDLAGEPVAVIALGELLGLSTELGHDAQGAEQRIVVVATGGFRVGLLVDRIQGVVDVGASEHHPLELVRGDRLVEAAAAEIRTPEGVVVLLDLAKLLEAARV